MSVAGLAVKGLVDVEGADEAGLDAEALRRAFDLLASWVEADVLPGAAALVARGGKVAGEAYLGLAHRAQQRAVGRGDHLVAGVSDQALHRGGGDAPGGRRAPLPGRAPLPDAPRVPRWRASAFDRKAVTLRHVLSHCSGLPGFSPDNNALRQAHRPLEDFVRSFGAQPLLFAPGSAHYYSNPGILLAAEAVGRALAGTLGERVPGPAVSRYHPFVHERILAPLGMESSGLPPPPEWDGRIAWVERTGTEGMDWEGANSRYYRTLGIPWGGLYSRPRELVRYVDLFLPLAGGRQRVGAGAGEGVQLVSPATAQAMTAVQFGPPDAPPELAPELRDAAARTPPLAVVEWGLGWTVKGTKRPHFSGELTSALTYGHLGATGTMVWADPAQDVACVLLTNRTLVSGWTQERPRQALFSNAVMAALR